MRQNQDSKLLVMIGNVMLSALHLWAQPLWGMLKLKSYCEKRNNPKLAKKFDSAINAYMRPYLAAVEKVCPNLYDAPAYE